jgi:hypothetical protein
MLAVVHRHLHPLDDLPHQLSHSLRLSHRQHNALLLHHPHLQSQPSPLLKQLTVYPVARHPVTLHKLALQQNHVVSGRLVGVGCQTQRQVR